MNWNAMLIAVLPPKRLRRETRLESLDNARVLAAATRETKPLEPARLIAPMLQRLMATDRAFAKVRRELKGGG